jgi:hypothetical protein
MLSDKFVRDFIKKNDLLFNNKLSDFIAYPRVVSLAHFSYLVEKYKIKNQNNVGVISGNKNEPELKFIKKKSVEFLNFENNKKYDLDKEWRHKKKKFSFIICNQVLEHIFNPITGFKNILYHAIKGAYIWITIPVINCIHGEPHFFSSGYHPRFLEKLAMLNNCKILHLGYWGSRKYLINAVLGHWLNANELSGKIKNLKSLRQLLHPMYFFINGTKDQSKNIKSNYVFNKSTVITDTWILIKKLN